MLADNIILLKKNFPEVYEQIKTYGEKKNSAVFFLEKSKDGHNTLKYQENDKIIYVHSKYNPVREANSIINKLEENEEITNESHVVFYGVGLGYHIQVFAERHPEVSFSIIEPSFEVMNFFLEKVRLKTLNSKRIISLQFTNDLNVFFERIFEKRDKQLIICELSAYSNIFKSEYELFLNRFKSNVKEQRMYFNINYAFEKRWVINSVNNFKEVLVTPNILMENNDVFKGKTAILVSAGPSLNYEIENLKKIKNEGLAFIFSVGSAINTMIHFDVYPHAMCTYDPLEENQLAFRKVNELAINTIPMIFGSSVGYETLEQYSGPKYHMITNQDTVADYFLKTKTDKQNEIVSDAPSIAIVTLELMIKLGFSQIILVGQNLAYLNDRHYADGVTYEEDKIVDTVLISDNYGNMIETTEAFINMKNAFESTIEKYSPKIINTTIGGAKIAGTEYKELNYLLSEDLTKEIIKGTEFESITQSDIYNQKYIFDQLNNMKIAFKNYNELITDIKNYLAQLKVMVSLGKKSQIKETHQKMDRLIGILQKNDFFKVFGLPLNRVAYKLLVNEINDKRNIKNEVRALSGIIKPTEEFIDLLYIDSALNENIISVLTNIIELEFAKGDK